MAAEVTQETNDKKQLLPPIAPIAANLKQTPEKVSADAGCFSEANVTDKSVKDVDLYVATGRDKHGVAVETSSDPPLRLAWQRECQPRVEAGVRGEQPAEVVPGRLGSRNGINGGSGVRFTQNSTGGSL